VHNFLLHTTEPDVHSLIVRSSLSSYQVEISHKYTHEEDVEQKYSEVYCLYTFSDSHAKSLNGGWQVFEPFGPVELVQLPADPETGQCKGFGFVQVRCMLVFSASLKYCSTPEVPQQILYVAIFFICCSVYWDYYLLCSTSG
jgi:hypothetical protein